MGLLTTAEYYQDVRLAFGNPDTAKYTDVMLLRWLNGAYIHDVCSDPRHDIPELNTMLDKSTAAANPTVSMSDDEFLRVVDVVRASDSHVLERIDATDYAQQSGILTSTQVGEPEKWYLTYDSGPVLRIWPCPNAIYALKVIVRRRPEVLADGDETTIPEQWDSAIECFFGSRFARILRLPEEAKDWFNFAEVLAAKAMGVEVYGTLMKRNLSSGRPSARINE